MNFIYIFDGERVVEDISNFIKIDLMFGENFVSFCRVPSEFHL